jgi:uncharacterized protein DUF4382
MNVHSARRLAFCLLLGLLPIGCSNSGGSASGGASAKSGTLEISLADASSDQIDRFEVDLKAIDLVKKNGAIVHALPITTRVDFAELVDVAEILDTITVPLGSYIEADLTLDFSAAAIHIAGAANPATALTENGAPLTGVLTVKIQLDAQRPLVIAPGLTHLLTFDFDLDASTTVDVGANTVTVSPVLVADIDLERPRVHRVRGPLEQVNVDGGNFFIDLHPFRVKESRFGSLQVFAATDTDFEVNGIPYVGLAGLEAMASLDRFTGVIAEGGYLNDGRFVATSVVAGSGVPGGTLDVVRGHVTSRTGNDLTVIGADLDRSQGSVTFNTNVSIHLNAGVTRVIRELSQSPFSIDDISVGQKIVAFGTISGSVGALVLDPVQQVRMLRTKLTGKVKSTGAGGLTMEVQLIGLRQPSIFNFAGTGPAGFPADPADYQVATGSINLAGLQAGSPIRVFGFVTHFGTAPPDFEALSVVDVSGVGALMEIVWQASGTHQQFQTLSAEKMVFDLTDSPTTHHVVRALAVTDLSQLSATTLSPASADPGFYVVSEAGTVSVFKLFADFVNHIQARLADGKRVKRLCSLGHFDDGSVEMKSMVVSVVIAGS